MGGGGGGGGGECVGKCEGEFMRFRGWPGCLLFIKYFLNVSLITFMC